MMDASSHPPHHRLPLSSGGRRRSRRAWQEEQEEELKGQMPPPPLPPLVSGRFPVVPPSPFVLAEANPGLFTAVLTNWTWQECSDCRMVLAAPGVYPISEEIHILQGGRRLMLEASVDGVILQLLFPLSIFGATLVLRRLVVDGGNQAFTRSGCLDIADSTVEAYDTIFRHTIGVNCAGVACVRLGSSFIASGCTFEHNTCADARGGGAIGMLGQEPGNGPSPLPAPWVVLDRCRFYENSCLGDGGAVKAVSRGFLSITNSVFIGQQAQGFGGAVYASTERDQNPNWDHPPTPPLPYTAADLTVIIRGCEFRRNQAVRNVPIWGGGAIYSNANLTVSRSSFYDNQVLSQIGRWESDIAIGGGALWNDGILRGSDLHFEGNEAARMGGAVLLNRGSAVLRRCAFVGNKAGNQGGALFVNASRNAAPSLPPPASPGAFVQDCVFQGNGVTGFPAPYYTFSYPFGGGALAVWGRLLVHNSSFLDNAPPPGAEANGSVAHVDGHGVLQLAFCSFAVASAGRQQRLGLRPGDLHLATPHAATRCLGTHVEAGETAAGVGGAHCFVGPAGGEPWATPMLFLLLGLPVGFAVYLLLLLASPARRWQHRQRRAGPAPWPRGWLVHGSLAAAEEEEEESDDEHEHDGDKASEEARTWSGGYDPAATFPIPPSGSATMWRFLRGRRGPRHRSSAAAAAPPLPALLQDGSGASASTLSESEQDSKDGSEEDSGERTDKEQEGSEGGGNIYSSSSSSGGDGKEEAAAEEAATPEAPGSGDSSRGNSGGASDAKKKEEQQEDEDVLDWPKTRAYRLSLGAELRDPTKPGELGANHLEPFALEGRGRNVFQVTDPQPLTHSRFGRLYFARNTGVGGQPPCLMLIYNRFKHEAATLVTEKELLHTGSSSTCPFLLRHLDDFFHERVGYYVALTPCCRETLHQRLCRAAQAPQWDGPAHAQAHAHAHALDFPTCVRYLHEILQGLGALRDLRMVHGRLSLNAVLLTPDDHVRLWDYGVPPSAAVRRPDKPTAYSAPEVWDMLRMNPTPVSSMDSWSAGVVGYMLAAKALAVTLPACAPRYRAETYVDYFREYLERQRGGRGGGGSGGGGGGHPPSQPQYEPYFPSLPSVDPAFLEEDRRDHGGALVGVLSRLLDVNANRRLPLEAAELEVRQIVQRAVLLARSGGCGTGGGVVVDGGGAAAGGGGGDTK